MTKRFTDEQIIRIFREAESRGEPGKDLGKRHNISGQTFYRWRNKFGGMDVADARRLKELESENDRLKRLIAEQMLVIDGLKEFSRKNDHPDGQARSAGSPDSAGAVATQGMSLPGTEPRSGDLYAQATREGSESRREADSGRARGAALRLSPDVGLAGVERIARAANVASPAVQHSAVTSSPTSLRQRHTPARRHTAKFGLEL